MGVVIIVVLALASCHERLTDKRLNTLVTIALSLELYHNDSGSWPYAETGPVDALLLCVPDAGSVPFFDSERYEPPFDEKTGTPWFEYLNPAPPAVNGDSTILLSCVHDSKGENLLTVFTTDSMLLSGPVNSDRRISTDSLLGMSVAEFLKRVSQVVYIRKVGEGTPMVGSSDLAPSNESI